jgi:hypothetical protein
MATPIERFAHWLHRKRNECHLRGCSEPAVAQHGDYAYCSSEHAEADFEEQYDAIA